MSLVYHLTLYTEGSIGTLHMGILRLSEVMTFAQVCLASEQWNWNLYPVLILKPPRVDLLHTYHLSNITWFNYEIVTKMYKL